MQEDLDYDLEEILGIHKTPPPPPSPRELFQNGDQVEGVQFTKGQAKLLSQKIKYALRKKNRIRYYKLFSKTIHWWLFYPFLILGALTGAGIFTNLTPVSTNSTTSLDWLQITCGLLS